MAMKNLKELTEKYIEQYLNPDNAPTPEIFKFRKETAIEIKYFMDWLIEEIEKDEQ